MDPSQKQMSILLLLHTEKRESKAENMRKKLGDHIAFCRSDCQESRVVALRVVTVVLILAHPIVTMTVSLT